LEILKVIPNKMDVINGAFFGRHTGCQPGKNCLPQRNKTWKQRWIIWLKNFVLSTVLFTVPVPYTVKNTFEFRWNSGDANGGADRLCAGNVFFRYRQEFGLHLRWYHRNSTGIQKSFLQCVSAKINGHLYPTLPRIFMDRLLVKERRRYEVCPRTNVKITVKSKVNTFLGKLFLHDLGMPFWSWYMFFSPLKNS